MSVKPVYQCDGVNCAETRKDTNHWFLLHEIDDTLTIQPWNAAFADNEVLHMCGQSCVQKFVEGWMNSLANSEGQPK